VGDGLAAGVPAKSWGKRLALEVSRVQDFVRERVDLFDRRPVSRQEWDDASGDTPEQPDLRK
jgi:hypothetical protein